MSKKTPSPEPVPVNESRGAQSLLTFLAQTGTGLARQEVCRKWIREHEDGTAEELYQHLEETECAVGTLRKAGKWLYGDEFEPESAIEPDAADEIARLRRENAQHVREVARVNADRAAAEARIRHLEKQQKEQLDELTILRNSRLAHPLPTEES